MVGQQEIKCNVHSCRHNDERNHCKLKDITVGVDGAMNDAKSKADTICASFEA